MLWMTGRILGGFVSALSGWLMWWALLLAGFAAASAWFGVVHVLGTYEYRGGSRNRTYVACDYWGPFGKVEAVPGQPGVPEDCPFLAFLPLGERLESLLGKRLP